MVVWATGGEDEQSIDHCQNPLFGCSLLKVNKICGGLSLKRYFGKSGLSIFVNVSSIDILKKRLINRGTESNEEIEERLLKAKEEFTLKNKFDLIIDNDDLSDTLKNLKNTVQKFINN